ncbi:MAG: HNH endonuclease [Verrucomicrobiota bacterium]|nr:HNH endonuclease [Verrucomicrobiota bacterium]
MVYLEKSQPPPKSLSDEINKKSGFYRKLDVVERLEQDFRNKCYICEQKAPTNINIEHFKPYQDDKKLKFDWNNLFLSCAHCNNVKSVNFDNLLNCTVFSDNVDVALHYKCDSFPKEKVLIKELQKSAKTKQTKELL